MSVLQHRTSDSVQTYTIIKQETPSVVFMPAQCLLMRLNFSLFTLEFQCGLNFSLNSNECW